MNERTTMTVLPSEYDEMKRFRDNEKARADGAEIKCAEMHKMIVQQEASLQQAWALRDEAIKERQEAEAALRSALRLTAYLINDVLRGMPE